MLHLHATSVLVRRSVCIGLARGSWQRYLVTMMKAILSVKSVHCVDGQRFDIPCPRRAQRGASKVKSLTSKGGVMFYLLVPQRCRCACYLYHRVRHCYGVRGSIWVDCSTQSKSSMMKTYFVLFPSLRAAVVSSVHAFARIRPIWGPPQKNTPTLPSVHPMRFRY